MLPRHNLRAARGCDAVSQIFQVKFKNLGKNQNFDTPTTFMSLQDEEKFPLLENDQNTMTPLLRALEGLPSEVPLRNHFQKNVLHKNYFRTNFWPKIFSHTGWNMARKWGGFWPFLTPCAQTWPARGPHPWSSVVPSGDYQITPQSCWWGQAFQIYRPKTKHIVNRGEI